MNRRTQMTTRLLTIYLKSCAQPLKEKFEFFPQPLRPIMLLVTGQALKACLGKEFGQLSHGVRDLGDMIQFLYHVTPILKVFKVYLLLECSYFFQLCIGDILTPALLWNGIRQLEWNPALILVCGWWNLTLMY